MSNKLHCFLITYTITASIWLYPYMYILSAAFHPIKIYSRVLHSYTSWKAWAVLNSIALRLAGMGSRLYVHSASFQFSEVSLPIDHSMTTDIWSLIPIQSVCPSQFSFRFQWLSPHFTSSTLLSWISFHFSATAAIYAFPLANIVDYIP